jgi:RNase P subunit RPR2
MPKFYHEPWANQVRAAESVICPSCKRHMRPNILGTNVSRRLHVRVIVECRTCGHEWSTNKVSLPSVAIVVAVGNRTYGQE